MKDKKGFTLVELLAVIIILAVIALIAIPVIINTIESAKKSAAVSSTYGYVDAINYAQGLSDFDSSYQRLEDGTYETSNITNLKMKGNKPLYGEVTIENNIVKTVSICINGYLVNYENKEAKTNGKCSSQPDTTDPIIIIDEVNATTNSIIIDFTVSDPESGIKSTTCKVGDKTGTINGNTCTISGLTNHTEYTYEITVKNGQNRTKTITNTITTGEFQSIVISANPEKSKWTQTRTITITGKRENETLQYQIVNSIEDIDDDNWTNYAQPVTINENKSVIVRLSDGTNVSSAETYTENKIDNNKPTEANVTRKSTTSNSITVTTNGISEPSGIYGYQFSKDNGSTWSEIQTSNEYTFSNLTTGTYQIKSKVINNTYEGMQEINNNNSKISDTNSITTDTISEPTYEVSPNTTYATSKTVTITYPNGYTNEYSLDGGTTWHTYTEPVEFTSDGTILARVTDGTNEVYGYISGSSYTVSGIDTTPPSASASVGDRTTTSVVVNATCADSDSNISKIEYQKDNGSWIDNGTTTSYTFSSLSQGTSYNFKVRCTNGAGTPVESEATTGVTKAVAVFDGNGGSNGTSITADVGAQLGELPTTSRTNYYFDGWYTTSDGGTKIDENTIMPSGGTTYYAHWNKNLSKFVQVGDYVRMTPNPGTLDSQNRYSTNTSKTGYSTVQYIYPKELKLWRVIRINSNGTIDMVSEYVSSTNVYFRGATGYANFVGYLNTLASQYENSTYTSGSRYMGYNGQTQTITNTAAFNGSSNSAPWTSSTTSTANQKPSNEAQGGGDTLYTTDTGLVTTAVGSLVAKKCNDTSCSNPTAAQTYWLASRYYRYYSSTYFRFHGRNVNASGSISYYFIRYYNSGWDDYSSSYALRPIVTLKSGLSVSDAVGSSSDPFILG